MTYTLSILGQQVTVTIQELKELLDDYGIDQLNVIYYQLQPDIKEQLREYFIARMAAHLGI